MNKLLAKVEAPHLKSGLPDFRPGDTVRVHVKVVEGDSERIQPFEGVVISRRGGGIAENYTVRKVSFGVGVERTFPLHSPRVTKIEVVRQGRARRAKLFYLRKLTGKAARLNEKEEAQLQEGASDASQAAPAAPASAAAPKKALEPAAR